MKIISTNTAQPTTIYWGGEDRISGIYKKPQPDGIYLTPEGVLGDTIGNPKVHGGAMKAAYVFSRDEYPYWKSKYPDLKWEFGMFGENLTVEGLDERTLLMGSTYKIGGATVRITTPREPCFKLGVRFSDQEIIQKFVDRGCPGAYVCVLESGWVRPGDSMALVEKATAQISIGDFFSLWYSKAKNPKLLEQAVLNPMLSEDKRRRLLKWME